jgi:hypothetical protein
MKSKLNKAGVIGCIGVSSEDATEGRIIDGPARRHDTAAQASQSQRLLRCTRRHDGPRKKGTADIIIRYFVRVPLAIMCVPLALALLIVLATLAHVEFYDKQSGYAL